MIHQKIAIHRGKVQNSKGGGVGFENHLIDKNIFTYCFYPNNSNIGVE